jgi:hypothetical protein
MFIDRKKEGSGGAYTPNGGGPDFQNGSRG